MGGLTVRSNEGGNVVVPANTEAASTEHGVDADAHGAGGQPTLHQGETLAEGDKRRNEEAAQRLSNPKLWAATYGATAGQGEDGGLTVDEEGVARKSE